MRESISGGTDAAGSEAEGRAGANSPAWKLFAGGTTLCDGAMGSMLYGRGIFINRCYDELNATQPDMVRGVHHGVPAGRRNQVIETNTFGANRHSGWIGFGLEATSVREFNLAGVRPSLGNAWTAIQEKQASEKRSWRARWGLWESSWLRKGTSEPEAEGERSLFGSDHGRWRKVACGSASSSKR